MKHLKIYARLATIDILRYQGSQENVSIAVPKRLTSDLGDLALSASAKRRRLSLPGELATFHHGLDERSQEDNMGVFFIPVLENENDERPMRNAMGDALFKEQVLT